MKKIILLCLFSIFGVTISLAQLREIKGIVSDSGGHTLVGASVTLKGSSAGTSTDAKGEFVLKVPTTKSRPVLTISYVGYATQTLTVKDDEPLVIKLALGAQTNGEEVVVIGYQSIKRKDIAGAISTIGARDLKDVVVNSAEEAITGKLAGVQVTTSEGAPGSQVQIQVRGGGSVTQSNAPLYIIDGVESDEGISMIAPQDIETIDVLKDASATSIYGARAANGVVVVTTKGGKNTKGKLTVSYNGSVGLNKLNKELPVMDPYNFMKLQYERQYFASDSSAITTYGNSWNTVDSMKNVPNFDWQNKMFGRNAIQQTHNVSMSGGTAQTQYYLSLTDNAQDGIFQNSEYDRKLVTFKMDTKASDKVKIGFNVRYNRTTVDGSGTTDPNGDQSLSFLRQIIRYKPFFKAGESADGFDPNFENLTGGNGLYLINPVLLNQQMYRHNVTDNYVLSGYLNYQLTDHISFRTTVGYDITDLQQNLFNDTITVFALRSGGKLPSASINMDKKIILNNSNVFTYTNTSSENPFTLLLGEETYQNLENVNSMQTLYLPKGITSEKALANIGTYTSPSPWNPGISATPSENATRIVSFFTSAKYNLHKKYQLSASLRADGASVFSPYTSNGKWGYFPSVGASWLLSKERFMENFNYLSDIKVRASVGVVGNAHIPDHLYDQYYTSSNSGYTLNGVLNAGYNIGNLANTNLQWESTFSRNIGFDFGILRNKFQVSVDVYSNTTNKLLVKVPLPQSSGYTSQIQNVGSTNNTGVELQLAGTLVRERDFTWSFSFNVSHNDNIIKSLGSEQNFYLQNSGWAGASNLADYIVKVGEKVGSMYGYVNDGFYTTNDFNWTPNGNMTSDNKQLGTYTLKPGVASNAGVTSTVVQPGSIKYKDLNGDGIVDYNDRTIIGCSQPIAFGGLTQTFKYKNWDASIFLNYRIGGNVVNDNKLEFTSGYTPGANMLAVMDNRWSVVNDNGVAYQQYDGKSTVTGVSPDNLNSINKNSSIWLPSVGSSSSAFSPMSYAIEDASFLRINNITIGYSLSGTSSLMKRVGVTRLRVYATVNNLAVITGYSGYDPEVNTRRDSPLTPNVDYSAYPRSRGYVCGINLNF